MQPYKNCEDYCNKQMEKMKKMKHVTMFRSIALVFAFTVIILLIASDIPQGSKGLSTTWFSKLGKVPTLDTASIHPSNSLGKRLIYPTAMANGDGKKSIGKKKKKKDGKLEKIEARLASARTLIKHATVKPNHNRILEDAEFVKQGDIYRNAYAFHRSYHLMEKLFKVFVYEEGEPPLFHNGICKNIYSMEGIFMSLIESNTQIRTKNPDEAHVFFLPFSVVMILQYLFHPVVRDKAVLGRTIGDYVNTISQRYPYWNKSYGADHFMLSCHDWGPRATWYVKELYFISIRVLCNANISEHFNPNKDVSIPEINFIDGNTTGVTGGYPILNRTILAFFAGHMHGKIRPAVFQHWLDKDRDIQVYERLPPGISYHESMKKSRYCLCPSGWEVASPRIAEAIYAECVPVIISQHYVLPFSDVLDWDAFSIRVAVHEIPKLKKILMSIPESEYTRMQENVKRVQKHFLVNNPPKRYDVFHMIMHSIWLRRLNLRVA